MIAQSVDDCFRRHLPGLMHDGATPFAENRNDSLLRKVFKALKICSAEIMIKVTILKPDARVSKDDVWSKPKLEVNRKMVTVGLGKIAGIRWERYAFVKGGALMGENTGKLTSGSVSLIKRVSIAQLLEIVFCRILWNYYKYTERQMEKADQIASSFLGTDVGILAPGSYSTLFLTQLQNGFKWNSTTCMWATREDAVGVHTKINPRLRKIKTGQYFKQAPRLLQNLSLTSNDDIKFIHQTAAEPARIISKLGKLGAWNPFGHKLYAEDSFSTPFQLLEVGGCRRVMMQSIESENDDEKNRVIRSARATHGRGCEPCFVTEAHIIYPGGNDLAFFVSILQNIEDVIKNGKWINDANHGPCFTANDVVGVAGTDDMKCRTPGPCLFISPGKAKTQGKTPSKTYVALMFSLKTNVPINSAEPLAIDMRNLDTDKAMVLITALKIYFADCIWSDTDTRNEYARIVGDAVYKFADICIGISKESL